MRTADDLVRVEVHYCVSSLVSTLASCWDADYVNPDMDALHEQAQELCYPIEDWEEAAREGGWEQSPEGWWDTGAFTSAAAASEAAQLYDTAQEVCEGEEIEPHEWEVYEHWIVSDWLADKLAQNGEKVDKDFAGLTVWARTTTGQAIAMDSVIQKIVADLNGEA